MRVGLNYPFPWNAYGTYFGSGRPPGSQPELDAWLTHLRKNLVVMRDELNISVVRIFLMCNLANYGARTHQRWTPPETLPAPFCEHLQSMLQIVSEARLQVIPSLLDFKALGKRVHSPKGDNGCMDRHPLIKNEHYRARFLDTVLDTFLRLSLPHEACIFAWEVINEPIWLCIPRPMPASVCGGRTLSLREIHTFLTDCVTLIERRGFQSTVGHRFRDDLKRLPTGSRPQFHYYPTSIWGRTLIDRRLPTYEETKATVGEFGVMGPRGQHGDSWPELHGEDAGSTRARVRARLSLIKARGYPLCLLWPDGIDGKEGRALPPGPDPIQLSENAQRGLVDFMRG